jgi:hypothetical protein
MRRSDDADPGKENKEQEYGGGDADVDPSHGSLPCRYSDFFYFIADAERTQRPETEASFSPNKGSVKLLDIFSAPLYAIVRGEK